MHDPQVLLLDEPTVGVDIDARLQLLQFVRDSARAGAAVLYSTHQMIEVEQLASRVVVLDHGRVLARGTVEELIATYSPPLAELRFSSSSVTLPGVLNQDLDQMRSTSDDQTVALVRLPEASATVADLVDELGDQARAQLVSAQILAPSFENAYVRITRRANEAAGSDSEPPRGSGYPGPRGDQRSGP
jgi:ABC-2 type transport system ATP-binding protein